MPTKKRKYNARFPAGRIKKIMQTDEEVGKVAQAVPIIIFTGTPRTLELFVESLLSKAMQVTVARNAKTLSPSHVKQCILAESKFDFLRDLVKNIPDVSAAEEKEKELMSAESSPNTSRFQDMAVPPRRIAREDSNSSSSCDVKTPVKQVLKEHIRRNVSVEEPRTESRTVRLENAKPDTVTTTPDVAIDLSKKNTEDRPIVTANFYQETLLTDEMGHPSVITLNPTYTSPQPSTSYTPEPLKLEPVPKQVFIQKPLVSRKPFTICLSPQTPVIPIVNIDFTKNITKPEIKLLDTAAVGMVGVTNTLTHDKTPLRQMHRQNSKPAKLDIKKIEVKPIGPSMDIDSLNSGNLQIDEDYDT